MKNRKSNEQDWIYNLGELLEKAIKKRSSIPANALRLLNGVGDKTPGITLDKYNQHYLLQVFDIQLEKRAEYIGRNVLDLLDDAEYFVIKMRCWADGLSLEKAPTYVLLDKNGPETIVEEYGVKFNVNLNDAVNTGLFLDMRTNRNMVGKTCFGKKVLNGFSYTCSFGAHAAKAGAVQTINVDISQKILDIGKANYKLNELPVNDITFVQADVIDYLERACNAGEKYDVIILDPPSFARYKGKAFSAKQAFGDMARWSVHLLNENGSLFLSTNNSSLTCEFLFDRISEAINNCDKIIKTRKFIGQGPDYPGSGKVKESYLAGVWVNLG